MVEELELALETPTWAGQSDVVIEQLFFNTVMYLPLHYLTIRDNGDMTVQQIITQIHDRASDVNDPFEISDSTATNLEYLEAISRTHPNLMSATISNYSGNMTRLATNSPFDWRAISAATFTTSDARSSISFRGTPEGAWVDNGHGLSGIPQKLYTDANERNWNYLSYIDQLSLEYFRYLIDNGLIRDNPTISGHSKGSRQAMLIGLIYGNEINHVFGFCGQNISPEMWDELRAHFTPEELEAIRNNITAINITNDFVHPLGWSRRDGFVAGNVYWIDGGGKTLDDPTLNHYITAYFTLDTDDYGNVVAIFNKYGLTEMGPLALFIKEISDRAMQLPPEEREIATRFIMGIAQMALGNGRSVNFSCEDVIEFLATMDRGLAITIDIIAEVLRDPEMRALLGEYLQDIPLIQDVLNWIQNILLAVEKFSINHPLLAAKLRRLVTAFIGGIISFFMRLFAMIGWIAKATIFVRRAFALLRDFISNISEQIKHLANHLRETVIQFGNRLRQTISDLSKKARQGFQNTWDASRQALEEIANRIRTLAGSLKSFIANAQAAIKNGLNWLGNQLSNGLSAIGSWFRNTGDNISSGLQSLTNAVSKGWNQLTNNVKSFANNLEKNILPHLNHSASPFKNIVSEVSAGMPFLTKLDRSILERDLTNITKNITDAFRKATSTLTSRTKKINDFIAHIPPLQIPNARLNLTRNNLTKQQHANHSITTHFTDSSGIHYEKINDLLRKVDRFGNQAEEMEQQLSQILRNLSNLRFRQMNTSSLQSAKNLIKDQKLKMAHYYTGLRNYERQCRELEQGFIHALTTFN